MDCVQNTGEEVKYVYDVAHVKDNENNMKDKVPNDEIYRRSGLAPMTDRFIEQNLRWT